MAKDIAGRMDKNAKDGAFVAGLLHDIGKLSPWYQELFAGTREEAELGEIYGHRQHAAFSAWAARHLLFRQQDAHCIVHAIAGHHNRLRTNMYAPDDKKSIKAQEVMLANLRKFKNCVCADNSAYSDEWKNLEWDRCLKKFCGRLNFPIKNHDNEECVETYLCAKCIFSALLQADRGSFHKLQRPEFSIRMQTTHSGDSDSDVNKERKSFQDMAFESYVQNSDAEVIVIEAPTGIGKTDLIFRILGHHSNQQSHDRAFYFSPLLALTDGFIMALLEGNGGARPAILDKNDAERILEYNHMAKKPISERRSSEHKKTLDPIADHEQKNATLFNINSFNYPFIVSTTIRLLLTLYGNTVGSCIKFASLSKSIIIVDEIQTIPKALLPSLVQMLSWIAKSSGSKIILVSATIPAEISSMNLCQIRCDGNIATKFMSHTLKYISTEPSLRLDDVLGAAPSLTAVMFNTRADAKSFQGNRDALLDRYGKVIYLTSGIRKQDRLEHIRNIVASTDHVQNTVVISTQVLEAGVDASFERMFREMAPMDSIVQAMGRLNRHGKKAAKITVFGRDPPFPYRGVEIKITQEILDNLPTDSPVTSIDVYRKIRDYYSELTKRDMESKECANRLECRMSEHNYDSVWSTVSDVTGNADHNIDVILPYPNKTPNVDPDMCFDSLYKELKETVSVGNDRNRGSPVWNRAARLSASLPTRVFAKVENMMDQSLLELDICIPHSNDAISELYDKEIGLDRWVQEGEAIC